VVLENDCHSASLMPHFDIVHAVIPNWVPTPRKRLRTINETALRIFYNYGEFVMQTETRAVQTTAAVPISVSSPPATEATAAHVPRICRC